MSRTILVLVSLNPDRTDLNGFQFPISGEIECLNYRADHEITSGFYGTAWGNTKNNKWFNKDPQAKWCVVRVDQDNELIKLEDEFSFVKFRKGVISCNDTREECCRYIVRNAPADLKPNVAYRIVEETQKGSHIISKGSGSRATALLPDTHAINVGEEGVARVVGNFSCAVSLGHKGECDATNEDSAAIVFGGKSKAISVGVRSKAIAIQTDSLVVAGIDGLAAAFAPDCTGMTGANGVLILTYQDGGKIRYKIGYAGEELKADTLYKVNDTGNFEELA